MVASGTMAGSGCHTYGRATRSSADTPTQSLILLASNTANKRALQVAGSHALIK